MTGGKITNRIRTLRFLHGEMSQGDLGQAIGVTRQTIAAIEAGKYSPSLEAAFRIAGVFGKPLDEVFQWEAEGQAARAAPSSPAGSPSPGPGTGNLHPGGRRTVPEK